MTDTSNEQLARRAETHAVLRKGFMVINALAYIGWMTSLALGGSDLLSTGLWEAVRNLSRTVWLISLILIVTQLGLLRRKPALARLVDDERSARNTHLAYRVGYFVLLVAIAAVYLATFYVAGLSLSVVMPLLLAAGVTAPAFAVTFFGAD